MVLDSGNFAGVYCRLYHFKCCLTVQNLLGLKHVA